MKALKFSDENEFLDETIYNDTVKEFCQELLDESWGEFYHMDEIECRSRDGFIPYSHNKGGFDVYGYSDLYSCWASGNILNDDMQKYIDTGFNDALEQFKDDNKDELQGIDEDKVNYNDLCDLGRSDLAESLSEYETEHLSGDYSSVQTLFRFLYHGNNTATILVGISFTDAPYHRSFDIVPFEKEISWENANELKKILDSYKDDILSEA